MTLIRLYLDIDGVLNAIPGRIGGYNLAGGWGDYETIRCNGYTITYSPTLITRLNALSEKVEIVFSTTWEEDVKLLAPMIGLPVFPHLELWDHHLGSLGGKAVAISDYEEKFPAAHTIWVDDHNAGLTRHDREIIDEIVGVENMVIIAPMAEIGLSDMNMKRIEDLVDDWT